MNPSPWGCHAMTNQPAAGPRTRRPGTPSLRQQWPDWPTRAAHGLAQGIAALVSGFAGEHPERHIEAAAVAPYPLAGDIAVNGVWLSDVPHQVRELRQTYDFATGELSSSFAVEAGGRSLRCEVLTFASREDPTLVCQELSVRADGACDVQLRAGIDAAGVGGRALRHLRETPGEDRPACDGALLWESPGALGQVGCAYATEMSGGEGAPPLSRCARRSPADRLLSTYGFRARRAVRYRLRQFSEPCAQASCTFPTGPAGRPHGGESPV